MLAIQRHIIDHGLDATIEKFKLDFKDYPHKILLKYKQIESPMSEPEVQDARGLVLKKSDWSVMSLAFRKFFNHGEGKGEPIDWSTARIFEKLDGTLIHAYYDDVLYRWCFGTTGTAEGEGPVDNFHWGAGNGTFSDLFMRALRDTNISLGYTDNIHGVPSFDIDPLGYVSHFFDRTFDRKKTIAFELCTPNNIVVTPHANYRVYLLGIRDLISMHEFHVGDDINMNFSTKGLIVPIPRIFKLSDVEDIQRMVAMQPFGMEGVVACDANFNRRKIKNPAYVAVHFMRDATAYWRIVDVVRSGEVDEYLAYFPGRTLEVSDIERKWNELKSRMQSVEMLVESHAVATKIHAPESAESKLARKLAAEFIIKITNENGLGPWKAYFFTMLGGTKTVEPGMVRSVKSLDDYLLTYDGHDMFDALKRWK